MPYKSKVPCNHPGCPNLVKPGDKYCDKHLPLHKAECRKNYKEDRPSRRGGNLYNTARWKRLRLKVLGKEPFCRRCMAEGHAVIATDVDHIIDHEGDARLFWDEENLQPLCHSCHSKKTYGKENVFQKTYHY